MVTQATSASCSYSFQDMSCMINANNFTIEMVYMTHVCVSARASTHPTLQTPLLSSGGVPNHPKPSSETPFRLFRLSQPPDRIPHLLRPDHKIDPLIPPRQRNVKGIRQSLPHHDRVRYWR